MPSINYFFKETYYKYIPHLILGIFITLTVIYTFVLNIINDLEYMLNFKIKKKNNNLIFYYFSFFIIVAIYLSYFVVDNYQIKYFFLIPICFLFILGFKEYKIIFKFFEFFIICLCLILIAEYFFNSFFYLKQIKLPTYDLVLSDLEISKSLVNGQFNPPKYLEYCLSIGNCKSFRHLGGNILFELPTPFYRPASIYHSPAYFTQLLIFSFLLSRNNSLNLFKIIKIAALILSGSSAIILIFSYLILRNYNNFKNIFFIIFIFIFFFLFSYLFNNYFFSLNFSELQFVTSFIYRINWIINFLLNYSLYLLAFLCLLLFIYYKFKKILFNQSIFLYIELIFIITIIFLVHPDTFKSFFGILFISLSLTYFKGINNYK